MKNWITFVLFILLFSAAALAEPEARLFAEGDIELFPIEETSTQENSVIQTTHTFFTAVPDIELEYAATFSEGVRVQKITLSYDEIEETYTIDELVGKTYTRTIGELPAGKQVDLTITYEKLRPETTTAGTSQTAEENAQDEDTQELRTAPANADFAVESTQEKTIEEQAHTIEQDDTKKPSWLLWGIILVLVAGLVTWPAFQKLKKKNVMLVSFKEAEEKKLAQVLANKTCSKILEILSDGELSESEIAKKLGVSMSRVHYNLQQLLEAKLVEQDEYKYGKKKNKMKIYRLTNKYLVIGPPEKEEN